jgi:hypothetical protein
MQLSQWFHQQLQTSTEGFLWAVEQIPQERHYLAPRSDEWSVARPIYHMLCYDQRIGSPTLRQWVGEPCPVVGPPEEDGATEEINWNSGEGHEVRAMSTEFKKLRAEQLALIQQFPERAWSEGHHAIWGSVTLQWVVTKTYQHTLEHTNEILRLHLWWQLHNL